MRTTMSASELDRAASMLSRTERARKVMANALKMLEEGGIGLDGMGQVALFALLYGAFGGYASSARDAMGNALTSVDIRCDHCGKPHFEGECKV